MGAGGAGGSLPGPSGSQAVLVPPGAPRVSAPRRSAAAARSGDLQALDAPGPQGLPEAEYQEGVQHKCVFPARP